MTHDLRTKKPPVRRHERRDSLPLFCFLGISLPSKMLFCPLPPPLLPPLDLLLNSMTGRISHSSDRVSLLEHDQPGPHPGTRQPSSIQHADRRGPRLQDGAIRVEASFYFMVAVLFVIAWLPLIGPVMVLCFSPFLPGRHGGTNKLRDEQGVLSMIVAG